MTSQILYSTGERSTLAFYSLPFPLGQEAFASVEVLGALIADDRVNAGNGLNCH
jgi:hypothetical protein